MDRTDVKRLVLYAAELWPATFRLPTSAEGLDLRIDVWHEFLEDRRYESGRAALAAQAEQEFAPPPGLLRALCLEIEQAPLAPDGTAAVEEIMRAIRVHGYLEQPEWSHPAIGEAVAAFGGWQTVCESMHPESLRAHLLRLYETARLRHRQHENRPPAITGLLERAGLPPLTLTTESIHPSRQDSALPSEPEVDAQRNVANVRAIRGELAKGDDHDEGVAG